MVLFSCQLYPHGNAKLTPPGHIHKSGTPGAVMGKESDQSLYNIVYDRVPKDIYIYIMIYTRTVCIMYI